MGQTPESADSGLHDSTGADGQEACHPGWVDLKKDNPNQALVRRPFTQTMYPRREDLRLPPVAASNPGGNCVRDLLTCVVALTVAAAALPRGQSGRGIVAEGVTRLTRDSAWARVAAIPIAFRTFHPQGMVKIGDVLFVSSVEVTVRPRRFPAPVGGYDRDPGEGI